MMGHQIQGKQQKPEEMTWLHDSLRDKMVAAQLQQKKVLRSTQETRSEPTITRYGVVLTTQHQDYKTIKETGLQENRTIQNLGEDWNKRI